MLSSRLKKLNPYIAGEQPRNLDFIKLNTNENPYPPCENVQTVLSKFDSAELRLYPDPNSTQLREAIALKHQVKPENVIVSNGSDEVLSWIFYAFFDSDENGHLLFPEHTYSFYEVYCSYYGIDYKKISLKEDFSIDTKDYLEQEKSCGIIFSNPNAPTSVLLSRDKIIGLLKKYDKNRVVVIDEAYIDFSIGGSVIDLVGKHKNLVVVRTFSKSMSLAGMRLGYAVAHSDLIDALYCAKDSFNSYPVDRIAQKIGLAAVENSSYYEFNAKKVIETRERFSEKLTSMGWIVPKSGANFLFVSKKGLSGQYIYEFLKKRAILVRYFHKKGLEDFVRITIGTDAAMDTLIKTLEGIG